MGGGAALTQKRIMEATDIAQMIYTAAHLSPQACVEEITTSTATGRSVGEGNKARLPFNLRLLPIVHWHVV